MIEWPSIVLRYNLSGGIPLAQLCVCFYLVPGWYRRAPSCSRWLATPRCSFGFTGEFVAWERQYVHAAVNNNP